MRNRRVFFNILFILFVTLALFSSIPETSSWFGKKTETVLSTSTSTQYVTVTTDTRYLKSTTTTTITTTTSGTYTLTLLEKDEFWNWVKMSIYDPEEGIYKTELVKYWTTSTHLERYIETYRFTYISTKTSTATTSTSYLKTTQTISLPNSLMAPKVSTYPLGKNLFLNWAGGAFTGAVSCGLFNFGKATDQATGLIAGVESGLLGGIAGGIAGALWAGIEWAIGPPGSEKPAPEHFVGIVIAVILIAIAYGQYHKLLELRGKAKTLKFTKSTRIRTIVVILPIPFIAFIIADLFELEFIPKMALLLISGFIMGAVEIKIFGSQRSLLSRLKRIKSK